MKLPDFKTEQWMNVYEGMARLNMTDTCVEPLSFQELMRMDTDHLLDRVTMDYGEIPGDTELRKQILSLYQKGKIENITMAQGCLQANEMVMETLLEAGDHVITFTPSYQQFSSLPASIGCQVTEIPLIEEKGWAPAWDQLEEAMRQKVKMIILNNPNNPTGSFLEREDLIRLCSLAQKQGTWILSDEVYRGLHEEEVSVSDLYERGISTASLSKLFSLAGLRLGWIKASEELIHTINVRRDYSIISTGPMVDAMGRIALNHKEELLNRSRSITDANRKVLREYLQEDSRLSCVIPKAGTVCFLKYDAPVKSADLARGILQKDGVFFVPGSCFACESHLRYGLSRDPEMMKRGLHLLSAYLDSCGR
jgi:aspartate/methionine/tyrosine aminotransferase